MTVFSDPALYALGIGAPIIAVVEALNAVTYSIPSAENTVYAVVKLVPQAAPVLARGSTTSEFQVQLTWAAIDTTNSSGSAVTGYSLYWDNGVGASNISISLTNISSPSTLSYTQTTGLTPGSIYNYAIRATNVIGTGNASSALAVTVAATPDQLGPATTTLSTLSARIAWPATSSIHSSAITSYVIQIKKADGTYAVNVTECDGSSPTIVTNRYCTILMSTLTGPAYSLTAGTPIIAQVAAVNAAG
jgi:hypothetical protein